MKFWPCLFGLRCAGQCADGVFTCSACGWRDVYGSRKAFPELHHEESISDAALIARQAKRIAEMEGQCEQLSTAIDNAAAGFVCIGGPLNDNINEYNTKQKRELHGIYMILKDAQDTCDEFGTRNR